MAHFQKWRASASESNPGDAATLACVVGKNPEESVFTRNGKPVSDYRGTWDVIQKTGLVFDR